MSSTFHTPVISVIIPVFRPGKHFKRCLESVRNQTFSDIEIILIDDCGNDGALDDIKQIQLRDSRIRLIKNSANIGPGLSRNEGIKAARGEYLSFIDSDDHIAPDFYALLYKKATCSDSDNKPEIVCGSFMSVNSNGKSFSLGSQLTHNERITKWQPKEKSKAFNSFCSNHWCAIYLREWIIKEHILFGTTFYSEDSTFLLKASWNASSLAVEKKALIYHTDNENSLMHNVSAFRIAEMTRAFSEQIAFLCESRCEILPYAYIEGRVTWLLSNLSLTMAADIGSDVTDVYLEKIKETLLITPWIDELKKRYFTIRLLIDYNCNLVPPNIINHKEGLDEKACILTFIRCFDFIEAHPENKSDAFRAITLSCNKVLLFDNELKRIKSSSRNSFRKQCSNIFKNRAVPGLSKTEIIWQIYLKTGINLFNKYLFKLYNYLKKSR